MKYERINQNSLAQFMRTRIRYVHVSARLATVSVPGTTGQYKTIVVRPGTSFSAGRNKAKRERREVQS